MEMEMVGSVMSMRMLVLVGLPGFLVAWAVWKLVYMVWWKPLKTQRWLRKQGIHGPSYQLLFGNARETMSMFFEAWSKPMSLSHDIAPRVLPFFHQVVKKYGKLSLVWNGSTPTLIVASPELVKEILKNKSGDFQMAPPPPSMRPLVTGILLQEGEKWAAHRKTLNPAFHLEQLKGMLPNFAFSCNELINKWDKLTAASGSCELDVFPELQEVAQNVIAKMIYGEKHEDGKRLFQVQKELAEMAYRGLWKIQLPGFRFIPTKENIRVKKLNDEVTFIIQDMIRTRVKEMKMGVAGNGDLMTRLLEAYMIDNESKEPGSFKKVGMSMHDVVEECKLFYLAGQLSTAVLLTWTMILLAMHPEWQARARDEVLQICGGEVPTFDHLNKLKIVTMVLHEVLRLYPPAAMQARYASKRVKLGTFEIPAGVLLLIPALFIQHDPEIWGDDANQFKPERFSEGVAHASEHQLGFIPFSWGPRVCIGQNFAMLEAKLVLAMILPQFSFKLSPSYSHAPCPVLTLQPQHGAHLILQKI